MTCGGDVLEGRRSEQSSKWELKSNRLQGGHATATQLAAIVHRAGLAEVRSRRSISRLTFGAFRLRLFADALEPTALLIRRGRLLAAFRANGVASAVPNITSFSAS